MASGVMDPREMGKLESQRSALPSQHDLEAAFDRCGAGREALRECVLACRRSARRSLDAELHRVLTARGHDPRELCARELNARLADISVGELLQMIAMGRKDAVIEVVHGALVSRIWCSAGEIVDAVSGRLQGESAAYRILALDAGELIADFRPVARSRVIARSIQELTLEAVRRKDECALLQQRLGGAQRVYSSVARAVPPGAATEMESDALRAFAPGAAVDTVLAGSTHADLETLQAVSALVEQGYLVANDRSSLPMVSAGPSPPGPRRRPWLRSRELTRGRVSVLLAASAALGVAAAAVWPMRLSPAPRLPEQSTGRLSATPATPTTPAAPTTPARPDVSESAGPSARGTYSVDIAVEPAQAAFWLDGELMAAGDFRILLSRDGRMHELRIAAPGHVAQTVLFRDVSPPRAVVLERAGAPAR